MLSKTIVFSYFIPLNISLTVLKIVEYIRYLEHAFVIGVTAYAAMVLTTI